MFQTRENQAVFDILQDIVVAKKNIFQSENHAALTLLQDHVPILVDFVHAATNGGMDMPADNTRDILAHFVDMCRAPFSTAASPPNHYPPLTEQPLSCFPNLPLHRGRRKYAADRHQKSNHTDSCRKASYGHPSLTPGIFTLFCPHGICYGYEVMQSCESPSHPFNIFRQRFHAAPQVIVYDNACKLHQYCLNRGPQFFAKTLYVVDRFHGVAISDAQQDTI